MSAELSINNIVQNASSFPYVVLEGYSFTWTNGVFLSAVTNTEIFSSLELVYIDDFVNVRSVSASCPPVSAYKVSNYSFDGDNFMLVEVPSIGTGQIETFHVLVKNRAGYTFTSLFSSIPPQTPPPTQSNTPTPSITKTPYLTPSQTSTLTLTPTRTVPLPTLTPTKTSAQTQTPTPSVTKTPYLTPSPTPTLTLTPTRTVPLPTLTNTRTPPVTPTPTNTIGVTPSPTKTIPLSPTPTATPNIINDCGTTLSGFAEDASTYKTFRVRTIQPWGSLQAVAYDAVSEPELYLMTLSGQILGSSGFVGDLSYNDLMIQLGYGPMAGGPRGSFNYATPFYPINAPVTETFILSVFSPLKNSRFYANAICPSVTPSNTITSTPTPTNTITPTQTFTPTVTPTPTFAMPAGFAIWLDPTNSASVLDASGNPCTPNTPVAVWRDLSINARHFEQQAEPSARPTLSAYAGMNYIKFTAANFTALTGNDNVLTFSNGASGITLFAVTKFGNENVFFATDSETIFANTIGTGTNGSRVKLMTNPSRVKLPGVPGNPGNEGFYFSAGGRRTDADINDGGAPLDYTTATTKNTTAPGVFAAVIDYTGVYSTTTPTSGTVQLYFNGLAAGNDPAFQTAGNVSPTNAGRAAMGRRFIGLSPHYHNGIIGEFVAYDRILTPAEIAAVNVYLMSKWNIG